MVRVFIGISVPEIIRERVDETKKKISDLKIDCKFVERENLHISLSFLGNVEDEDVVKIAAKMDALVKGYKKFVAKVGELKFIPSIKYVRVIAFDVYDSEKVLQKVSSQIKSEIGGDIKPPHLTVCRLREGADKTKIRELEGTSMDEEFGVGSINLFQSQLSSKGPVYTVLHESKLS